jgi:spore germination protein YaaH
MKNKKTLAILLIVIIGAGSALFFLMKGSEVDQGIFPLNPDHKLSFTGSLGHFNVEPGIASIKENINRLDYISLFWYKLNEDGSVQRAGELEDFVEEDILSFLSQHDAVVMVGIENDEEADKVDPILNDEGLRKNHISQVLNLIQNKGYDGVIVDFENLRKDQAELFTNYLKELAAALRAKNKILSVSVNTETEGRVFHGIDILEVSQVADRVELNVYEEFDAYTGPGPIASIGWVEKTIKNAIDQGVPTDKIVLGTSHAGHDWLLGPTNELVEDTTTIHILKYAQNENARLKWDKSAQSNFFNYRDPAEREHIVWIEDARSFKTKLNLAQAYELQGVFIWYLGGEDPQIWAELENMR